MHIVGTSRSCLRVRCWLAAGAGVALISLGTVLAAAARTPPGSRQAIAPDTCVTANCHPSIVDHPDVHEPVAQRRCDACHTSTSDDEHTFRLTRPSQELCLDCHVITPGRTPHEPVAAGECLGCHDAHGSDHRALLLAPNTAALCDRCHEQRYRERRFVHGPVASGACVVCHDAHGGADDALLVTRADRLCITCHRVLEPRGSAARHLHKPMESGCTTCHDPHGSNVRYQLHEENTTLCTGCHTGVEAFLEQAKMVHGAIREANGCGNCHDPHFTLLPDLQKVPQPESCMACHDRPIIRPDGHVLPDMAALLRDNPEHHGPIVTGACTACHNPHGGDRFGFLYLEYPAGFYAPYEPSLYALCFSCHLSELVQDASGTGLTGFRDGDLNLHWLHVNQSKGRTCRACHEVHASMRPFHIREAVPFGPGGWMLEINFEVLEDGGTCLPACHQRHDYHRDADRREGQAR